MSRLLNVISFVSAWAVAIGGLYRVPLKKHERSFEATLASIQAHFVNLQASASTDNHTLPIRNFHDVVFTGRMYVGTPPQAADVIFDTGSANIFVPDKQPNHGEKHLYDHSASSTYKANNEKIRFQYGSGPVSGVLSQDSIEWGGFKLRDFTFAEVDDVSGLGQKYTENPWDGVFGLAFGAQNGLTAPLKALAKSGELADVSFAFYLGSGDTSELVFGGVDPNHYTGDFTYVPLNAETYWQVHLNDMKLGTDRIANKLLPAKSAIVDSGTALLVGPAWAVQKIAEKAGAVFQRGAVHAQCDKVASMPDLTWVLGTEDGVGSPFSVKMSDTIVQKQGDKCLLGIQGRPKQSMWILGDVFMRVWYVKHDWTKKRLGFARAASSMPVVGSPAVVV